jgi:hypothetical protein
MKRCCRRSRHESFAVLAGEEVHPPQYHDDSAVALEGERAKFEI